MQEEMTHVDYWVFFGLLVALAVLSITIAFNLPEAKPSQYEPLVKHAVKDCWTGLLIEVRGEKTGKVYQHLYAANNSEYRLDKGECP